MKNWIYAQWITIMKKKYFVLVRPVILYEIEDRINLIQFFSQDMLQERDNLELQIIHYILSGNGKSIRGISNSNTSIQLVRTCLVLNWDQDKKLSSIEKGHASFVELSIKGLVRYFLKMDLGKSHISYIRKRKDPLGSRFILDNESDWTNINPFFFIDPREKVQQSLSQNHGTIHMFLNRNEKCRSLIILSSTNCFQIRSFHDGKYYNGIKEEINPIQRDPLIPIQNSLGPLGIALQVAHFYFYLLITNNQISINKNGQLDKLKETFQVFKYYLIDENEIIYKSDLSSNILLNPFYLNWHFFHHNYCEKKNVSHNKSWSIYLRKCMYSSNEK